MRAIADGLFTDEVPPRLLGGHDRYTGRIVFPCPADDRYVSIPLKRSGTVWSYTIQRFRPKTPPYTGPSIFVPFAIAYVELADEVIVEARLTNVTHDDIYIGMPVELIPVALDPNAEEPVFVPAFQPLGNTI